MFPGSELYGIRFILNLRPCNKRIKPFASSIESVRSRIRIYSNVIRLRDSKGNSRQTFISCSRLYALLTGISFERTLSVTPLRDIARLALIFSLPKLRIFGKSPEVETVMRRCEKLNPCSSVRISSACIRFL